MTGVRALSAQERRWWLRLARTRRVGPVTFRDLITRYGDAEAALAALPALARRAGASTRIPAWASIDAELEALARFEATLIASCEPAFPPLLRALDPPPPLIAVAGAVHHLTQPCVALVGSRNASAVARRFARDLAGGLGEAGYVVVSGLARGIDGAAHQGAMSTGTVAVVAGGVDHVYPPEHAELYTAIRERGAVVSETAFGRTPTNRDFPRRNRLISGLSLGTVVIEAAARSGSLITARYAGEQGREVMAAPGSPLDPRAKGANALIRDGAHLIETVDDVVAVLRGVRACHLDDPDRDGGYDAPLMPDDDAALTADVRERIADLLSPTPVSRDDLVRESGAPVRAVVMALVELELAGRAVQLPGGLVCAWDNGDDGDAD